MTVMKWIPEEYLPVMYLEPAFPLGIPAFFFIKWDDYESDLTGLWRRWNEILAAKQPAEVSWDGADIRGLNCGREGCECSLGDDNIEQGGALQAQGGNDPKRNSWNCLWSISSWGYLFLRSGRQPEESSQTGPISGGGDFRWRRLGRYIGRNLSKVQRLDHRREVKVGEHLMERPWCPSGLWWPKQLSVPPSRARKWAARGW